MQEQKPTIGRIVHYVSYGTPNGEYKPEHRAAIITAVHEGYEDGSCLVSLCILNPGGVFFSSEVAQDESDKAGGTWHWPERE